MKNNGEKDSAPQRKHSASGSAPAGALAPYAEEAASKVAALTLDEKISLCSGKDFRLSQSIERAGIPSFMLTNGPHGLRKRRSDSGHQMDIDDIKPATCFPTGSALACSWDVDLLHAVGVALGEKCRAEDVSVLLGPGMNIKRHPLCGRNFEYFSEDPLLSGELAAAMTCGVQSMGVGVCLKHYAANNQEFNRMVIDTIVDPRALHEIYLRGFEIAVKKSRPWVVMSAYNQINGQFCSENAHLLTEMLRERWGFEGFALTDSGAANDRVAGLLAGEDLEMPSSRGANDRRIASAVRAGKLPEATIERSAERVVALALHARQMRERPVTADDERHHQLAREAAAASAVLLKNDGGLLPLKADQKVAVIGAFAKSPRYQGSGSSQVTPTRLDDAWRCIEEAVPPGQLSFAPGYRVDAGAGDAEENQAMREQAVEHAAAADVAVVFAGLPPSYESEGFDRDHMRMPPEQLALIDAVCAANERTVVVLQNGSAVEMPWVGKAAAILECFLAGQAGGGAVADLLFGRANPSGKLAETFALHASDHPSDSWFAENMPGNGKQVQYREGLSVGYRHFNTAGAEVLFPFGHGLSYSAFTYSDLALSSAAIAAGEPLSLTFNLRNDSDVAGSEVVQLYVSPRRAPVWRPAHELKAFRKVALAPGESQSVSIELDRSAFERYCDEAGEWTVATGEFELQLGASSRDIRLAATVRLQGDARPGPAEGSPPGYRTASRQAYQPPERDGASWRLSDERFADMLGRPVPPAKRARPFDENSTFGDIASTWLGRKIRQRAEKTMAETVSADESASGDPAFLPWNQMHVRKILDGSPLRGMVLFGNGKVGFKTLEVMIAWMNGRYLKALSRMLRK